mgnify:CR=1 FL=1
MWFTFWGGDTVISVLLITTQFNTSTFANRGVTRNSLTLELYLSHVLPLTHTLELILRFFFVSPSTRASLRKKTEFLDKSSKTIDILPVFLEPT